MIYLPRLARLTNWEKNNELIMQNQILKKVGQRVALWFELREGFLDISVKYIFL